MTVPNSASLFCLFALCVSSSWAQLSITNGQVVSVPVSQTVVNVAADESGRSIVLSGTPTQAELYGDFSKFPQTIYIPSSFNAPSQPAPYPGNIIPISLTIPGGTFTSIGGAASVGANQTVSVDGFGSAWNIGSTLGVSSSGSLTLTNGGVVSVGTVSGNVSNAGAIAIDKGSSLSVSYNGLYSGSIYPNQTYVQTAGETKVDGVLKAELTIQGGTLGGGGVVNGSVFNAAMVAPGDLKTLTINGNYTQNQGGRLFIDITSAADFDILAVNGNVALGGDVIFNFLNGYMPGANTKFSFLETTGSVSGDFATINIMGLNCPTCVFDLSTLSLDTGSAAPTSTVPEPRTMAVVAMGLVFAAARKTLSETRSKS